MSVAQENFERAVQNADNTLKTLWGTHPSQIRLGKEPIERLRDWMWSLEAIAAALREELAAREDEPIDLG